MVQRCAPHCAQCAAEKGRASQNSEAFFGGPVSQGPSGQAKERTRILPVRRGFSAPGAPRHVLGWPFLRGLPLLRRLLHAVSVCPPCGFVCAFFICLLPFPVWLLPLKILFLCRSGRDGPLLSSEKKVDKDSRGALPLRTPLTVPCGQSSPLPRCWPA